MKKLKKLLSIVLAVAMVLSLVVVTSADDTTYTITINDSTSGYTYTAYQIFKGDYDSTSKVLSNIEWGSNIDTSKVSDLYTALAKIEDGEGKNPFTDTDGGALTSAADVAAALSGYTEKDNVVAKRFAEVVEGYITGDGTQSDEYDSDSKTYTITGLEAGYYLVENSSVPTTNGAYTRYLLSVVGDSTVTSKKDVPSVDKDLSDVDANIGDDITYYITATLPSNYADYESYKLVFHDTLSKGLTFDADSVEVYVFSSGDYKYDKNASDGTLVYADDYTVESSGENGAETAITVTLTNTKALHAYDEESRGNVITTNSSSQIVVKFKAKLNSDAVIGGTGNPNKVYLEYSNNPNSGGSDDTGTTPEDKVITWTYELDVTKVDKTDTKTELEGAQFVLYRIEEGTESKKEYVVITDGKVSGWTENTYNSDDTTKASVLESGSGGVFTVVGLDVGTYYLEEIEAPTGYNKLTSPITLKIDADYNSEETKIPTDDAYEIKTLTITVDSGTAESGDTSNGVVATNVENAKGSSLPSTGGIGTTIFYVVGGVLVLGAVVLLITKKRMGKEEK